MKIQPTEDQEYKLYRFVEHTGETFSTIYLENRQKLYLKTNKMTQELSQKSIYSVKGLDSNYRTLAMQLTPASFIFVGRCFDGLETL